MGPQMTSLVINQSGPDADNAAPASPEVQSPSRAERRRSTNAGLKALVSMMGQRKQEMKALAYDATFQEFQQKAAAEASTAAFSHSSESTSSHEAHVLSDAPMASTLELISRAGKAQNRTQAGVWSAFGKSYVCLGTPDVTLNDMPPVKRGDLSRQSAEESQRHNLEDRGGGKGRSRLRQRETSLSQQKTIHNASRRISCSGDESKEGPGGAALEGPSTSQSQPLPQLKSRRRDRVPFSEILFPREQVHVSDKGKRRARARGGVMGIGAGQQEESSTRGPSETPPPPAGPLSEAQQKTHSSRSAIAQLTLQLNPPSSRLVINLDPLRLPPPPPQHQGSTRSSKRGSSAPSSPHAAAPRRFSHARAHGAKLSPKPSALAALSPVAQFMLGFAATHERARTPRGGHAAAGPRLVREASLLGHAAMVGRKTGELTGNGVTEKKPPVPAERSLSSLSFESTIPRLHTEFDTLRQRMRDDLRARLEALRARRERCIESPRFMGTVSKLLVSQIRNVGRSYPIHTEGIWDLAKSSLQESAELLRARKEEQQNNALNVFYMQLCALVQAQNTTDNIMVLLVQKARSLLENGWTLQRPFLSELCRYIAQVEETSIFGSNPCLLPVLHFIRRRLCLPVPELNRILREAGIVFGSAGRLMHREIDTLGNITLQKLKPV
ncbi:hypothetical protein KFL_003140070 [Klebsormidium nitens]|uniref:Uncharacterized protein n=1 Tax=Klebsormidium nitens TaxID=105231 RepID=A0A1Y1IFE6_KLENI|nr:hypothetical protein KFL_003140070 [Klebsormidium nitens]|eukprot:GAQ86828.1 hypothetical protein KFL_003140070 [Klebsormidium nitens]